VKLDKLLKQLKRDAAKSPQKAGALGLMVLVALYFWAPLVMKNFRGKPKPGTATATGPVILRDDPILVKAAAHPSTNVAHWDRVRQALAQDRMMLAVAHDAGWKNPFGNLHLPEKTNSSPKPMANQGEPKTLPAAPPVKPEVAEQQLTGISVSSILMSKRGHVAVINSKVYRVGDLLDVDGPNGNAAEPRITAIDDDGIDLDLEGKPLRLDRAKPKLSSGEDLQRD
jgi:hypothetical protein